MLINNLQVCGIYRVNMVVQGTLCCPMFSSIHSGFFDLLSLRTNSSPNLRSLLGSGLLYYKATIVTKQTQSLLCIMKQFFLNIFCIIEIKAVFKIQKSRIEKKELHTHKWQYRA